MNVLVGVNDFVGVKVEVGIRVFDNVGIEVGVREGSGTVVCVELRVTGKGKLSVMVGTGDERTACKVSIRS